MISLKVAGMMIFMSNIFRHLPCLWLNCVFEPQAAGGWSPLKDVSSASCSGFYLESAIKFGEGFLIMVET